MIIETIDDLGSLEQFKSDWESVHAADKHANIFVSWSWMTAWLGQSPYKLQVLAARPEPQASPVAFLPLAGYTSEKQTLCPTRYMQMAGNPVADYTGMLCLPQYEQPAIAALSGHLKQMDWDIFAPRDVYDTRVEQVLGQLDGSGIAVSPEGNNHCPRVPLPPTWDEFLGGLSGDARKRIKVAFRKTDPEDHFHLVWPTESNFTTQLDAHMKLWHEQWGGEQSTVDRMRAIYRKCFDSGCLHLLVLWHNDTPVAGLASLVDRPNKTICTHSTAFAPSFAKFSVGKAVFAHTIKSAIEMGLTTCDFLRGDERYKSELGASEIRNVLHFCVARRTLRTTFRKALSTIERGA